MIKNENNMKNNMKKLRLALFSALAMFIFDSPAMTFWM